MKSYVFWLALLAQAPGISSAQNLRLGYFGETITHYGLKGAYEMPFASWVSSRNAVKRQLYGSLGIAGYRHPQNHLGVIVSPEIGFRRIGKRGALFEFAIAPSYFRHFLEGRTFEATSDSDFQRVRFAGGNAFLPTVSIGFGHDLSVRKKVPLAWYLRFKVMQQRRYNTSNLVRFALEAGTLIPLKKR